MSTPEELRTEIEAAFAGQAYPGDGALALSQSGCSGYEGEAVGKFFRGRTWRSLTLDDILRDPDLDPNAFMSFMTSQGFLYFLPAFLIMSLDVEADLGDLLAFKLTPPGEAASRAWKQHFAEIVAGLNVSQRRVVTKVLRYLDDANRQRQYTAPAFRGALKFWSPLIEGDEPNAMNGKPAP